MFFVSIEPGIYRTCSYDVLRRKTKRITHQETNNTNNKQQQKHTNKQKQITNTTKHKQTEKIITNYDEKVNQRSTHKTNTYAKESMRFYCG